MAAELGANNLRPLWNRSNLSVARSSLPHAPSGTIQISCDLRLYPGALHARDNHSVRGWRLRPAAR